MTIYTPAPGFPGGNLSSVFRPKAEVVVYNKDGVETSRTTTVAASDVREWYGRRSDMTRNKVRILTPTGTVWKPCTSYERSAALITTYFGTRKDTRKDGNGSRVVRGNPTRPGQTVAGPGVNAANYAVLSMSTNTRNRLNTEVMIKVGAKKASYGESLAESRQTINHLSGTVTSVVRALLAAKRGKWGDVAKHLKVPVKKRHVSKSLSGRWLEYQYAWLPMLGDINDSYELLKDGFRKEAQIASSVRALTSRETINEGRTTNQQWIRGTHKRVDFIKVFYRVNDSDLSRLNQLGLLNPASIAWELVPYSFVVDWFLPVGNVLEALTARFGVTFIDGYRGSVVDNDITVMQRWVDDAVYTTQSSSLQTRTQVHSFSRTKITSFPVPGLYYRNPFSTTHLLSALALLRQLSR